MCFNAKTSLITFTISLICFFYLLNRGLKTKNKNDIFLSIVTILIGVMQLIEFFLWSNQSCNNINHYFSLLTIIVLFLQGIITNLFYLKLYPNDYFFSKNFVKTIIFMYIIFLIYILYHLNNYNLCSKPSSNSCRLIWDSFVKLNYPENKFLYILFVCFYAFMFLIIFINSIYSKNTLLTRYPLRYSFLFITFIIAKIYVFVTSKFYEEIYIFIQNGNFSNLFKKILLLSSNDAFGSVWCFLCVFVGIIGILKI
jgi:hypothetical protein